MVHMGKEDLAALGAERAITAAIASEDDLLLDDPDGANLAARAGRRCLLRHLPGVIRAVWEQHGRWATRSRDTARHAQRSAPGHHGVDYWRDPAAPKPTSRKPSASVIVRNSAGELLLLRRSDSGRWTGS
jgi:hypothetical protein